MPSPSLSLDEDVDVSIQAALQRKGYDLVTANALWGARGTEFRSAFLTTARRKFGAKIETLDFARASDASRKRINRKASS